MTFLRIAYEYLTLLCLGVVLDSVQFHEFGHHSTRFTHDLNPSIIITVVVVVATGRTPNDKIGAQIDGR